MNSVSIKILAVAAVAVIAVAAICVFVLTQDNNKEKMTMNASLAVCGNADGDYVIDGEDKVIIQHIIDKDDGYTLAKYPLADADMNGTVDQADLDLVNKILSEEPCTIYHGVDDGEHGWAFVDTKWPINRAATSGNLQTLMLEKMAGIIERHIYGVSYSEEYGIDAYLYPTLQQYLGHSLGPSQKAYDTDLLSQCKTDTGITALIVGSVPKNAAAIEEMGIDLIRLESTTADLDRYISQILLLGFLFRESTQAIEIGKWSENLYAEMQSKLSTLKQDQLVTAVLNVGQTGTLTYKGSNYVSVLLQAGALYPDVLDVSSSPAIGDWIYTMDFDMIMCMRNSTPDHSWYGGTPDYERYFEAVYNTLGLTEPYLNGQVYAIGLDMPLPIRIAYFSQALYPDLYGEGWADKKHQEFIDKFFEEDFDTSTLDFLLEYKDYKDKLTFES